MWKLALGALFALGVLLPHAATAQQKPSNQDIAKEQQAAWDAAQATVVRGPASVKLIDQGTFDVPAGLAFMPRPAADRVMRSIGNSVGPDFLGLALNVDNPDWIATVKFKKDGHVSEDDAKDWNANELLQSLKQDTEAGNADRIARGFRPFTVAGWIEPPAFDAQNHRLVWSVALHSEGEAAGPRTVNYNTYLLGREGLYSLDFISNEAAIDGQKPLAKSLLASLHFAAGKRYEDFNSSTDTVAAYGLAALVGGVALKKLGLLALGAAFFLKFAKLIALAAIGAFAAFRKFFRRKPAGGSDAA